MAQTKHLPHRRAGSLHPPVHKRDQEPAGFRGLLAVLRANGRSVLWGFAAIAVLALLAVVASSVGH